MSWPTPVFVTGSYSAATSKTLTLPSAPSAGDLLLLLANLNDAAGTRTLSGFGASPVVIFEAVVTGSFSASFHALYRIAGSGESGSYTITWSGGSYTQQWILVNFGQCNATQPSASPNVVDPGDWFTSHTVPTVTIAESGTLAVYGIVGRNTGATPGVPAGWTDGQRSGSANFCYIDSPAAGAVGGQTVSSHGSFVDGRAFTIAFSPAGIAPPTFRAAWATNNNQLIV